MAALATRQVRALIDGRLLLRRGNVRSGCVRRFSDVMSRSAIRLRAATPLVEVVVRMPLNRVALTVGDRERSAAFCGDHFGLTRAIHDDEHLLMLRAARERLRDAGVTETEEPGRRAVRTRASRGFPAGIASSCSATDPRRVPGSRAAAGRSVTAQCKRVNIVRQPGIVDVTIDRGSGGDPAGGGDRSADVTSTPGRCGIDEGWLVVVLDG